jgi:hypothetical protein
VLVTGLTPSRIKPHYRQLFDIALHLFDSFATRLRAEKCIVHAVVVHRMNPFALMRKRLGEHRHDSNALREVEHHQILIRLKRTRVVTQRADDQNAQNAVCVTRHQCAVVAHIDFSFVMMHDVCFESAS